MGSQASRARPFTSGESSDSEGARAGLIQLDVAGVAIKPDDNGI